MQLKTLLAALAAAVLLCVPVLAADRPAAEPDDYRTGEYRAPVPATLKGGKVVDTEAAEAMFKAGAIFIDVFPQAPRPANLPKSTVWRAPKHESIKGSVWLPNVGYGVLNADFEKYFREHLAKLTGGDMAKPLVFFCLRDCWMSWNAAKRALEWGHTEVTWFPDGVDGWKEWSLEVDQVKPAK
ncbi:MAG: PQQ-dependent catabolism-associated CXXCW motif protein [Alphaproteobacteria bacterium]|nr:PQQ-dependent catabolism-associated CXXCW motif protein [Alphaproteobacteria bacterium]